MDNIDEHTANMDKLNQLFNQVKRQNFLPDYVQQDAALDIPLPIGYGQTCSQPSTVKLMLGWLDAGTGNIVLDVGSGSGWTAALLSRIVGSKGHVYAVDRLKELVEFGSANCRRVGVTNANFYLVEKELGLSKHAPYDRILVSAAYHEVPQELLNQLKPHGKMVIPVGDNLLEITKLSTHSVDTIIHPGFVFVALVK